MSNIPLDLSNPINVTIIAALVIIFIVALGFRIFPPREKSPTKVEEIAPAPVKTWEMEETEKREQEKQWFIDNYSRFSPEAQKLGREYHGIPSPQVATQQQVEFHWPAEARTKHLYIPGMSGYGKSTLMAHLALDDICRTNDPVIVIDPKGSKQGLVERILPHIPAHRVNDVVYISLRHPVALDLLGFRDNMEKNYVTGDIITILKRFSYGSWGPNMQGTLRKLIPTLLEAQDATFLDIGNFLESKKRRERILSQVSEERQDYWSENKPTSADIAPISSRMANFSEPPLKIIAGAKRGEGLNIAQLIEQNKIILIDTSPLSEDGLMLGALVMSRIQQAIFRRDPDIEYPCCHVYADEFQNFLTSAFNIMLSQSRSFNLSLCLANQHPKQITELWDDIKGCVSSYAVFRMESEHATTLKGIFQNPPPKDNRKELEDQQGFLADANARLAKLCDDHSFEDWTVAELSIEKKEVKRQIHIAQFNIAELEYKSRVVNLADRVPSLQVGHCIYRTANNTTFEIATPPPPDRSPGTNFAQSIRNRTNLSPACNSSDVRHHEVNDHRNANKEQEPEPGAAPAQLPPHEAD